MIIYVLDDGETWTLSEPTAVAITPEQLDRIEGGEKFYHVVPDWDERPEPLCNCVKCTTARTAAMEPNDYAMCVHCGASHHMDDDHQCTGQRLPYQKSIERARTGAEDFFVQAGIAAAEALKEAKRNYTKNIIDAQNKNASISKD